MDELMEELVLEAAGNLGITFSNNEEAPVIDTVGDLQQFLLKKLRGRISPRCRTSAAFYRLRSALMAELGVPRHAVRLDAQLEQLVPWKDRRYHWRRLGEVMEFQLPELRRSPLLKLFLLAFCMVATVIAAAFWFPVLHFASDGAMFFTLWSFGVAAMFAYALSTPFARFVPESCQTVAFMARTILHENPGPWVANDVGWHPREVWNVVLDRVAREAGVERDKLIPETRFVDIGLA